MDLKVLANKIKEYRHKNNLTQLELANKLKISRTTLSYYENASVEPNIYILINLATEFNTSIDDLIGFKVKKTKPNKNEFCDELTLLKSNYNDLKVIKNTVNKIYEKLSEESFYESNKRLKSNVEFSKDITPNIEELRENKILEFKNNAKNNENKYTHIPILGVVAAGNPSYACENILDNIYLPKGNFSPAFTYFGLKIKGDSMNKMFKDGEIIIVRKTSLVHDNDIVIAFVGDEATCKEYYYDKNNNKINLIPHSTNSKHKKQVYSVDEVQIIGLVEDSLNNLLDSYI